MNFRRLFFQKMIFLHGEKDNFKEHSQIWQASVEPTQNYSTLCVCIRPQKHDSTACKLCHGQYNIPHIILLACRVSHGSWKHPMKILISDSCANFFLHTNYDSSYHIWWEVIKSGTYKVVPMELRSKWTTVSL
jgi:hypothetical protein